MSRYQPKSMFKKYLNSQDYSQLIMYLDQQETQDKKQQMQKNQNRLSARMKRQASETEKPILTYYYIRGLCQPIRNLLYYLHVQFEDRRLDRASVQSLQLDKLESTFNSGLPAFRDGDISMSDSVAISIYICQKYHARNLLGRAPQVKSKVNQVMFKYWMEKKKIMPEIAEIIRKTTGYYQQQKGVMIRELINKLTNQTRFLNFCIKKHQETEGWILSDLTLIDFYFYETCFYVNGFFNSYIEGDQRLSYYVSFAQKFQQLEFHRKHDFHKTKLFFPFKSQNLRQIVVSAWQGDDNQQIL